MTAAAWWFRHQTRALIRRVQDPRWTIVLAVAPDYDGLRSRVWPRHLHRIAQGGGDLGDRMARQFRSAPPGPVCIIGGDIPGINKQHLNAAFRALGSAEAVFGPAPDGGYWLVGLKRSAAVPAGIFHRVRWSTEHALADTEASLKGVRLAQIATLNDVDDVSDLA